MFARNTVSSDIKRGINESMLNRAVKVQCLIDRKHATVDPRERIKEIDVLPSVSVRAVRIVGLSTYGPESYESVDSLAGILF